jgi:hypothetical protein
MRDITAYSHEVASFCSVSVNEWLWTTVAYALFLDHSPPFEAGIAWE